MPSAHRNQDYRQCGATTIAGLQQTVFVNNKLWAVENDTCDHGSGELIAEYSKKNIYIENQHVIVVGDIAGPDNQGHPFPPTDPTSGSPDVICYDAEQTGNIEYV